MQDNIVNIEEIITNKYKNIKFECNIERSKNPKIKVSCKVCNHIWETSVRNALVFSIACYICHKGKGYSMDELKILTYLHENYFPRDLTFRFAGSGGQQAMRNLKEPINIPGYKPPLYYQCDGFSRKTYNYDRETKTLTITGDKKGTVFEVLGDYHHSNPLFYKANGLSPRKNGYGIMTNLENFEYTMNRLKHIAEHGFKVKYIWISDFKRFSLDLEEAERTGGPKPNLFDYMNVKKHYPPEENNPHPLQEILDEI